MSIPTLLGSEWTLVAIVVVVLLVAGRRDLVDSYGVLTLNGVTNVAEDPVSIRK